ncbi:MULTISPECIES: YceI family protein [unclassified Motilimonas]|uniref:YceI family protein n=1 Tax=Motilimonas TaxID=1914248 RepID=UPI001E43886F|nr:MULTISPECIES: YceI family protein [unclassified Motilimonas]MCE0557265.1 YceI family protein [Motilimonas sp. E26]MDO6526138.1 YceI family protein [Motilimonas sp. 1_MG-2023]
MKKHLTAAILSAGLFAAATPALAADYAIDTRGAHASVNFKVNHLGYSWVVGRFDTFSGDFSYDQENPSAAKIAVTIDTKSVNSNHAERDKHIRGKDFLEVDKFPEAKFVSTKFDSTDGQTGKLHGQFTLRGVTKDIVIDVTKVGEGKDPWGGYRAGFEGATTITMKDYGIPMDLGPQSATVELEFHIEGIKK